MVEHIVDRADVRNRLDFSGAQHVAQSTGFGEFDRDILGCVEFLFADFVRAASVKQMRYRVCARRIGDERTHVLYRSRGVTGFLQKFARGRLLRVFAIVDHAGDQFEQRPANAVLVLPYEDDLAVGAQRENDHESAALAYVIIIDDGAVGQHDAIAAYPQIRTVQHVRGTGDLPPTLVHRRRTFARRVAGTRFIVA